MRPNGRSAAGSSGASLRTSRYPLSALPYSPAAKASLARDRSCSLVGCSLEQPATATASRQSAKISCRRPEAMLVIIEIMEVWPIQILSGLRRGSSQATGPLAPGVRLFNAYGGGSVVQDLLCTRTSLLSPSCPRSCGGCGYPAQRAAGTGDQRTAAGTTRQCVPTILATACVGKNITRHLGQTECVVEFAISQ